MPADESNNDDTQSFVVLTSGTEVSHYRIIEKIGAGGMGEVYLAEDSKLNRKVALKFLPSHLCQDEDCRKRFKREAQAAAKLSHPNIVTIHEVGEHQSRPYFVMEHVEGRSLRDIKAEELDIDRLIGIAIQLCDGLHTAHTTGVIHRDIKPSNIIIDSSGRPKLLDFGLATVKGGEHLTKTGSTLGTIGYMSPEQIEGKETDARSDLFSLGVVLYELIANKSPFRRDDETATLKAIIQDTPEPLARYKSDVPDDLQRIVSKLLEKDSSLRYQSAAGVIPDLKRLTSGSTASVTIEKKRDRWNRYVVSSVAVILLTVITVWYFGYRDRTPSSSANDDKIMLAVMPFENLGDPKDAYFAEGISREISSQLANIRELGVIGYASSASFSKSNYLVKEIASGLGVEYVLDGSVQWDNSGNTSIIRVIPQLMKMSDQTQVWTNDYERPLSSIFAVQREIAAEITNALNIALSVSDNRSSSNHSSVDPEAYDFYIRGKHYFSWTNWDWEETDLNLAERMLEKAVALEAGFAEAHARLSIVNTAFYRKRLDESQARLDKILESAETAIRLNPNLTEGHLALAWYYYYGLEQYDSAYESFSRAVTLSPDNSEANAGLARVKRRLGRFDDAVRGLEKAIRFEPRQPGYLMEMGFTLHWSHRHAEALPFFEKVLSLKPDMRVAHSYKAEATLHITGEPKRAIDVLHRALQFCPRWPAMTFHESELYFYDRKYDSALALLTDPDEVQWDWTVIDGPDSSNYYRHKGDVVGMIGDTNLSRIYYDSARVYLEAIDSSVAYQYDVELMSLAYVYAGLGKLGKAEDYLKLGFDRIEHDKLVTRSYFYYAARIYVLIGKYSRAIDYLERFIDEPSWGSVNFLKLDPMLDPLRDHPRFQALIEKYEKEHGKQ